MLTRSTFGARGTSSNAGFPRGGSAGRRTRVAKSVEQAHATPVRCARRSEDAAGPGGCHAAGRPDLIRRSVSYVASHGRLASCPNAQLPEFTRIGRVTLVAESEIREQEYLS